MQRLRAKSCGIRLYLFPSHPAALLGRTSGIDGSGFRGVVSAPVTAAVCAAAGPATPMTRQSGWNAGR